MKWVIRSPKGNVGSKIVLMNVQKFLLGDLRRKMRDAVHTSDLPLLVKRARTLGLSAFGVDIFDSEGRYVDTFVPVEGKLEYWYERWMEELMRRYPNHYFAFSFVPCPKEWLKV